MSPEQTLTAPPAPPARPAVDHRGRDVRRRARSRTPTASAARWTCSASVSAAPTPSPPASSARSRSCSGSPSGRARRPPSSALVARRAGARPDGGLRPGRTARTTRSAPARHLGVHGRVVGSFLSLLTAVAFFCISVWSSRRRAGRRGPPAGRPAADHPGLRRRLRRSSPSSCSSSASTASASCSRQQDRGRRRDARCSSSAIFAFAGDFDPSYAGIFTPQADAATSALFWPSFIGPP